MNKRRTSVLSSNFIREISNVFQRKCIVRRLSRDFDAFNKSAEDKSKSNDFNHLKQNCNMNLNTFLVAHLNINLVRNEFEALIQNVSREVDLLMISEAKTDESFPKSPFSIKGSSDSFCLDQNIDGDGILLYVREDIPAKTSSIESIPSERFFVEFNARKQKWLISCPCNPHKNNFSKNIELLSNNLDLFSSQYENNIIIEDFNVELICI